MKTIDKVNQQNKVAIVVGTRPSIIKMSPLIRELDKNKIENFVIHTGQHYSPEMDRVFFDDISIDYPRYHLDDVKDCYFHGEQTARMIEGVEQILLKERPKVVLVCGDANTNLAAGLAARKLRLIVGHVESGLRSFDWSMPEEHNRIILDHICELLFAPTQQSVENLKKDQVRGEIHLTGNTIVDAVKQNLDIAKRKSMILEELKIDNCKYGISTFHREENVDNSSRLRNILEGINLVAQNFGMEIIVPLHPRTEKRLSQFDEIKHSEYEKLRIIEPLGYLDFLLLLSGTEIVITDSGGIQEESCILGVPCVTTRENTERPETIAINANALSGTKPSSILSTVEKMINIDRKWKNPYGDGNAAKRIVKIVENVMNKSPKLFDTKEENRISDNIEN